MSDKNPGDTGHSAVDLEQLYREAETVDSEIFPEMRSNLLLIAGEHYTKRTASFFRRIRDSKDLQDQQKIRLTKNHIQKIHKTYVNNIVSMAPGVGFEPKNESELQDQKAAELHHAVWQDFCDRYNIPEKIDEWADDLDGIGEVHTKIFWDPDAGEVKAYQQKTDPQGQPLHYDVQGQETPLPQDPMTGQPHGMVPDESQPVFTGAFSLEDIYGFNLLRSPECKDLRKSPYLIIRKMAQVDDMKTRFPDKEKFLNASSDQTYTIFDHLKTGYRKAKNEVLIKEYYFRPGRQYPRGYFYIATKEGILAEGELPGGVFPIVTGFLDKFPTAPRGRSPIRQARPYQAEINRAASKMAEHQITLGDDKLILVNGSTASAGISLPGVRTINATGSAPTVMPGRDGSQYLSTMQANIEEMYMVMMVAEDSEEKQNGQLDPYALLFRAASQKKKFQRYVKRFERFLIEVARTAIKLSKVHLPDDQIIYAIGRKEQVNIAEFKNADDLCYQIKLIAESDDIETKMGKQLILNHALQYTANKMDKEDIGKLMRAMPYGNFEESFSDLTLDYDSVTNDILAMDRGETPQVHETDNHVYAMKRAVARMRQSDFQTLAPQIQQIYQGYLMQHQQYEQQRLMALKQAQSELIPVGGYLVGCDFYVSDPATPGKTRRAQVPYMALNWLIEQLQSQGQGQEELQNMDQGSQRVMSQGLQNGGGGQGMAPHGQPQGAAMPGRMM